MNIRSVKKLLRGVWDYNVISKFRVLKPRVLMVVLTYKCNCRCVMCNIWKVRPKKEMNLKQWKAVAIDSYLKEIETITISGGEAMLHPEYLKIVEMWVKELPKLNRIVLNTNGMLPAFAERMVKKILKTGDKKGVRLCVSVSVDGIGKVFDGIRGVIDGFERVEKTIKIVRKMKGVSLGLAAVLMRGNLKKYWRLKEWFEKIGIPHSFQLVGFHGTYVNNLESRNRLDFTKEQQNELEKVMEDLKQKNKVMAYYWEDMKQMYSGGRRTTPCPFLHDEVVVDGLGDVYYCLSAPLIGNLIKERRSLGEICTDPKNVKWRGAMWRKECRKCNSACDVSRALAGDMKKYVKFYLTGRVD